MQTQTAPADALRLAVGRIGSQSRTARLLGVSQAAVWKWVSKGKALPSEHVLAVERESGVSKHILRPDIYPADEPSYLSDAASVPPNDAPAFDKAQRA